MSPPRRPAPAPPSWMASWGLAAVIAALAVGGWDPAPRFLRAGAASSHRAKGCPQKRSRAHTKGRHEVIEHCPKAHRRRRRHHHHHHHASGSHGQSGSQGSTGAAGPTGTPPAPGTSGTPTTPTSSPAGPGTGESPTTPPPSTPEVQVSAVEYHYTLSRTTVPAGKVIIEFVDNGQDEHNLNAEGEGGSLAATFATEVPKAVTRKTVELHPGSYTLFCSLPEHEAKGMRATLTVE